MFSDTWEKMKKAADRVEKTSDKAIEGSDTNLVSILGPDPYYEKAVRLVLKHGRASARFIQKSFKVGNARAARIIDRMEEEKVVGKAHGSKAREILIDYEAYLKKQEQKKGRKS
jgi:DNA segregation ATPase FtsK/SpoIIIE-like protein